MTNERVLIDFRLAIPHEKLVEILENRLHAAEADLERVPDHVPVPADIIRRLKTYKMILAGVRHHAEVEADDWDTALVSHRLTLTEAEALGLIDLKTVYR